MKGLILADSPPDAAFLAGTSPSQLAPLANRPLLLYALDGLRDAGVAEVGIVVTHLGCEEVRAMAGDGGAWNLSISYIKVEHSFGVAGSILAAEPFLDGQPFICQMGETLATTPLAPLVESFERGGLSGLVAVQPSREAECVEGEEALIGLYVFGAETFDAIRGLRPSWRGRLEITEAIEALRSSGADVEQHEVRGWWRYGGTPEDLLEGNRLLLDRLEAHCGDRDGCQISGRVSIDPSARVESSIIRGPAVIGAGASLSQAYIGPYTSIGDFVRVEGAEIEDSIILQGATIRYLGSRLQTSIVGRNAKLFLDFSPPQSLRLRVGDGSEIALA